MKDQQQKEFYFSFKSLFASTFLQQIVYKENSINLYMKYPTKNITLCKESLQQKVGEVGKKKKEKTIDLTLKVSSVNFAAALKSKTTKVT